MIGLLSLLAGCAATVEPAARGPERAEEPGGGEHTGEPAPAEGEGEGDPDDSGAEPEPVEGPARYPADRLQSPITPAVRDRLAALAAAGGGDPAVFMKVGDSITADENALGCFAGSEVNLGDRDDLGATIDHFLAGEAGRYTPWDRESRAAEVGQTAAWAMEGDPSPLERELSALSPAFAVVQFGTNDMEMAETYKDAIWAYGEDMLDLTDELLGAGVIPLLVTIPPRLDDEGADRWVSNYNAVLRGIAQARQLPLVDLELGLRALDGYGLYSDGVHLEPYERGACRLGDNGLEYGCNVRNLLVLDGLDRLRRAALEGEALDEPESALAGEGTAADPFVVSGGLPFTDLRDTATDGERRIDRYEGCASEADESGRELVYRLELARETSVRVMVFDRGDVDVDLHLLGEEPTGEGCVERDDQHLRRTLGAGTWHLVVDTWVDGDGDARAGEYLLVVVED